MKGQPHKNFISKPRAPLSNKNKSSAKISDRRLASGKAAASYLLSEQQRHKPIPGSTGSESSSLVVLLQGSFSSLNHGEPYNHQTNENSSRYHYRTKNAGQNSEYTVQRQIGTKRWTDDSLLEWDPSHYRLFVGNLSPDVKEETLFNSFCQYSTLSKVKVPMEHAKKSSSSSAGVKGAVNKGYGFVSFSSADDYLKAFREMNGKYVGQFPIQLKRAQTDIKASRKKNNHKRH